METGNFLKYLMKEISMDRDTIYICGKPMSSCNREELEEALISAYSTLLLLSGDFNHLISLGAKHD
jgi:hypothetical protein